jgi:hypothetical protein
MIVPLSRPRSERSAATAATKWLPKVSNAEVAPASPSCSWRAKPQAMAHAVSCRPPVCAAAMRSTASAQARTTTGAQSALAAR